MITKLFKSFLFVLAISLLSGASQAPKTSAYKVILVELNVSYPKDARLCHTPQFDRNKVELEVGEKDPFFDLADLAISEDPLEGPDCFLPEMKVIYPEYTYIISIYCTSVKKYKNSSPYEPSKQLVKNDLPITESVLNMLMATRKKYFNSKFDPEVAKRFFSTNFDDPEIDDSVLFTDGEDEDKDLEKEASKDDKGWFDDKDPDLDKDETPDDPD